VIPKYEEIMLPFLQVLADGNEHSLNEVNGRLAVEFALSENEVRELLPSGQQPIFRNRVGWARTYLKKAGLLEAPKRASFRITDRGLSLLKEGHKEISSKFLTRYDEFVEFQSVKREKKTSIDTQVDQSYSSDDQTPEETIEYAFQKLNSDLSKELIEIVKSSTPAFFERLVVDLLIKMGYGGSRKEACQRQLKTDPLTS
jgi:restriction system protein